MNMNPEPEKLPLAVKILLLCFIILAGVAVQQSPAPERNIWGDLPTALAITVGHKQELRTQFGEYREGRISAQDMLKACQDKVRYAVTGKSVLAEYAYALRSQVYLDEGDLEAALAEARKAADRAPSPGRGAVALGDALRALGRDETAAEAYRQASRNPGYAPDYTVEDPMDAGTLKALLAADKRNYEEWQLENVTVRGKLTGVEITAFHTPVFMLEGRDPHCDLICFFNYDDLSAKAGNLMDGPAAILAKACGLSFATQSRSKFIILNGTGSFDGKMTGMDDCVVLKIEH